MLTPEQAQWYAEADKRGLLKPEEVSWYAEAKNRDLVPDVQSSAKPSPEPSVGGMEAVARGASSSLFNIPTHLMAFGESLGRKAAGGEFDYKKSIDEQNAANEQAWQAKPEAYGVGYTAGTIASLTLPGVGPGRAAYQAIKGGSTVGQLAIQGAKTGALYGGISGAGKSTTLDDVVPNVVEGAGIGATGGALLGGGVPKIIQGVVNAVPAGGGAVVGGIQGGINVVKKGVSSLYNTIKEGAGSTVKETLTPSPNIYETVKAGTKVVTESVGQAVSHPIDFIVDKFAPASVAKVFKEVTRTDPEVKKWLTQLSAEDQTKLIREFKGKPTVENVKQAIQNAFNKTMFEFMSPEVESKIVGGAKTTNRSAPGGMNMVSKEVDNNVDLTKYMYNKPWGTPEHREFKNANLINITEPEMRAVINAPIASQEANLVYDFAGVEKIPEDIQIDIIKKYKGDAMDFIKNPTPKAKQFFNMLYGI